MHPPLPCFDDVVRRRLLRDGMQGLRNYSLRIKQRAAQAITFYDRRHVVAISALLVHFVFCPRGALACNSRDDQATISFFRGVLWSSCSSKFGGA